LNEDGICIIKEFLNDNDINNILININNKKYKNTKNYLLNNESSIKKIKSYTNNNYNFQDYIWIIKKSHVHTCHRDYNGTFFNKNQKYDSYTLIIFLEDMDKNLGFIPKSHKNKYEYSINLFNNLKYIKCKKGDAIMFNANLVHVGAFSSKPDNLRIQLKVTHDEDRLILSYYDDYNKLADQDTKLPKKLIKMQKNFTCIFPFISDLSQTENINFAKNKESNDKTKIFSKIFYGNSNFYNLTNI
jgi:ectoine hydroxylase-related dioxygenase (phytanoyl-CoA dioxygenase family)